MQRKLVLSEVKFEELSHTYTAPDGTLLSGITSIIHDYIFPNMYSGVSQEVLERKAKHGTLVHSQIQMAIEGLPFNEELTETKRFREITKDINFPWSEYLVSDNKYIASSIDLVDDKFNLYDIKTTSVLNKEYLQWQLSIYAMLFEMQNPKKKAGELFAIHLTGDTAKLVSIPRLPGECVLALYKAYIDGVAPADFVNPLRVVSDDVQTLMEQYEAIEAQLIDYRSVVKNLEGQQAEILEQLRKIMDDGGNKKIENERFTVTRTADTEYTKTSFDLSKFQEDGNEFTDAMKAYVSESTVTRKGNVKVKFK